MQGMFRMLMHSNPSFPVSDFRNIAGVDLVIGQCRETFHSFPLCLVNCLLHREHAVSRYYGSIYDVATRSRR